MELKEIIISVLTDLSSKRPSNVDTIKVERTLNISGFSLQELTSYVKENGIKEFEFDAEDYRPQICWKEIRQTTKEEKEKTIAEYTKSMFRTGAFRRIRALALENGFKQTSFDIILWKSQGYTISKDMVYEMWQEKDIDKLVCYYSLYFRKTHQSD